MTYQPLKSRISCAFVGRTEEAVNVIEIKTIFLKNLKLLQKMNRSLNLNSISQHLNNQSSTVKFITSITIIGYLLSFSDTAVSFLLLKIIKINLSFFAWVLGICFISNSGKLTATQLLDMDSIYILLPGDSYLGSSNRYYSCG